MFAVGNGPEIRIDVSDQLQKIQRELPVCFDGADVVRPGIVFAWRARVVSVPSDDDDVVRSDEARDVIPAIDPRMVSSSSARRLVVPLAPAVKEINDRISAVGGLLHTLAAGKCENCALRRRRCCNARDPGCEPPAVPTHHWLRWSMKSDGVEERPHNSISID